MRLAEFIGFGKNDVMGLDIGSASVKAIEVHGKVGDYSVTGGANVPIEAVESDDERDVRKNTVAAVRRCVEQSGTKTSYAVCAVSGPEAAVRSFKFPTMPAEEIAYAVLLEAEQVSGLDMNSSVVDYKLEEVSKDCDRISGLLVAASAKAIQARKNIAKRANLQTVLVDVDSLAILNCFEQFGEDIYDRTVAILDIEREFTNLVITNNGTFPFVRNLSHGGDRIIECISAQQNICQENVSKILSGLPSEASGIDTVWNGFDQACGKLTDEIRETLRYYMTHERKCRINKVFLCGEFALVGDIDKLLSENLHMKVELWNPLKDASFAADAENSDELINNGPSMVTALGLAMRSI